MYSIVPSVKEPLAAVLAWCSVRTLFAIAHYQELPLPHAGSKEELAAGLAGALRGAAWELRLHERLGWPDRRLFAQLRQGYQPVELGPEGRYPWQLVGTWPALATLRPLERLMALGLVLPFRGATGYTLLIVEELAQVVDRCATEPGPQPRHLPAVPDLTALVDDAVTLLALRAGESAPHLASGRWPAAVIRQARPFCHAADLAPGAQRTRLHLLHQILHQAGYLVLIAAGCRPSVHVPVFLAQGPLDQLRRLLHAWAVLAPAAAAAAPVGVAPLDMGDPALIMWLWARLGALPAGAFRIADLLATWLPPVGDGAAALAPTASTAPLLPVPLAGAETLLDHLLRSLLPLLGLLETDGTWIAVPPMAAAWLRGTLILSGPAVPPRLVGTTVHVPALSVGALRYQLAPWAEPAPPTAAGYTYTFTLATLRRGVALYGGVRPLEMLLRRQFGALPPPLADLIRQAAQPAPLRLLPGPVLQAADPALLTALLTRRSLRRWLGPRFGPHTIQVRQAVPLRRALVRRGLLSMPPDPAGIAPASPDTSQHLVLALRLAQQAAPAYAPVFARLAADLHAALAPEQQAVLDELWGALDAAEVEEPVPAGGPPAGSLDLAAIRRILRTALEQGQILRMRYYSATRGVIGWRRIQPLVLHRTCLIAFCLQAQAERTFRLDRILDLDPTPPAAPAAASPRSARRAS